MSYNQTDNVRFRYNWCNGIATNITYSDCVSAALFIQHAKRMRRIILSSMACPAPQYFSTLSHKLHDFRGKKKVIKHNMRFDFPYNFGWNISHSKKNSVRYCHKCTKFFLCEVPVFFIFRILCPEKFSNLKLHKNSLLFHVDRRTDR